MDETALVFFRLNRSLCGDWASVEGVSLEPAHCNGDVEGGEDE